MAKTQTTLRYGVTEELDLGVAYSSANDKLTGLLTYRLTPETERTPAWILGVGVGRAGGAEHAFFGMGSKSFDAFGKQDLGLYLGAAKRENEDGLLAIGGARLRLGGAWGSSLQYDGSDFHLGLQRRFGEVSVAVVAVRMKDFGALISYRL